MYVRIVSRPSGGAPEHIRDAWIGLILPVIGPSKHPNPTAIGSGKAFTGPTYTVPQREALEILEQTSPEAARWFRENLSHPDNPLLFARECCEVFSDN